MYSTFHPAKVVIFSQICKFVFYTLIYLYPNTIRVGHWLAYYISRITHELPEYAQGRHHIRYQ